MKKNLMSILCLILALTMVFGLVACGAKEPEVEEPVVDEQPVEGEQTEEREHVELVFYTHCPVVGPGKEETMAAVNEYLKEKLNTTVDFQIYGTGDLAEVAGTIFASGAPMDAVNVGTAGGMDYVNNVTKNGFLPLEDYIDEYLPYTKEVLPAAAWDAYTYNGSIYGICAVKDLSNNLGMWVNTDMLDDLGVTFPENYQTFGDLVDFLKEVKTARDEKYPEKADQALIHQDHFRNYYWYNMDNYDGSFLTLANIPTLPSFSELAEDGSEIGCLYLQPEYRENAHIARELRELNVTCDPVEGGKELDQRLVTGEALGGNLWGNLGLEDLGFNREMMWAEKATLVTSGLMAGAWALPVQCSNVERTLEVIELLNSDRYLSTLMHFGPEGKGWTDEDGDGVLEFENTLNSDPDIVNKWWYQWYGWALASVPASYAPAGTPANFDEIMLAANAAGEPSANLGFAFDTTNVQTEMAACTSVVAEYGQILELGKTPDVDKTLDEFIAKLEASGLQTILDECQAQLDAWRAAKGL